MQLLAANPHKRWFERFLLCYSGIWIAAVVAVQWSGALATWGDVGHLALGVGLVLPIWVAPVFSTAPMVGTRFNVWVGLFAFLQCYFGSYLFFDVFGMEYHFHVRWIVNRTPLFLYFLTVAYFSTYYLAMSVVWRAFRAAWPRAPSLAKAAVLCALGYAVAFAETASMANERLRDYFSYRDKTWVMAIGSIFYGTLFVASLPRVFALDEDRAAPPPSLRRIVWDVLAVNMIVLCCYEIYAALVARA